MSAVVAGAPDLERAAGVSWWGVLAVLLSGAVWMSAATAPAPQATTWTKAELAFTRQFTVYGHDRHVFGCVTNCVTITTDHGQHGSHRVHVQHRGHRRRRFSFLLLPVADPLPTPDQIHIGIKILQKQCYGSAG
jgi:hypothetical protein